MTGVSVKSNMIHAFVVAELYDIIGRLETDMLYYQRLEQKYDNLERYQIYYGIWRKL